MTDTDFAAPFAAKTEDAAEADLLRSLDRVFTLDPAAGCERSGRTLASLARHLADRAVSAQEPRAIGEAEATLAYVRADIDELIAALRALKARR